jgi:hypothetical protein
VKRWRDVHTKPPLSARVPSRTCGPPKKFVCDQEEEAKEESQEESQKRYKKVRKEESKEESQKKKGKKEEFQKYHPGEKTQHTNKIFEHGRQQYLCYDCGGLGVCPGTDRRDTSKTVRKGWF